MRRMSTTLKASKILLVLTALIMVVFSCEKKKKPLPVYSLFDKTELTRTANSGDLNVSLQANLLLEFTEAYEIFIGDSINRVNGNLDTTKLQKQGFSPQLVSDPSLAFIPFKPVALIDLEQSFCPCIMCFADDEDKCCSPCEDNYLLPKGRIYLNDTKIKENDKPPYIKFLDKDKKILDSEQTLERLYNGVLVVNYNIRLSNYEKLAFVEKGGKALVVNRVPSEELGQATSNFIGTQQEYCDYLGIDLN